MSTRRLRLASLLLAASASTPTSADACWLTDWLCGRQHAGVPAAPYVVGYAPATTTTVVAGYPGTTAAYGAYLDNPNVYTGLPTSATILPTQGMGALPVVSARPVIGVPSASTSALPLATTGTVPIASAYRGPAPTSNPFYGTGNLYPNNYQVPAYSAQAPAYGSSSVGLPITAPSPATVYSSGTAGGGAGTMPLPASMIPATSTVPVYQDPRPAGGLARFFGSLFGTNYQTSTYQAPVTYYRPVTTVDPVTGATVTVQQPCVSSVPMVQRTPVRSYAVTQAPLTTPFPATLPPGTCAAPAAGLSYGGGVLPGASGLAPPTSNPSLPTTPNYGLAPSGSGAMAPTVNTAPLVGSPSDLSPVEPPRLESARPSTEPLGETTPPSTTPWDRWQNEPETSSPHQEGSSSQGTNGGSSTTGNGNGGNSAGFGVPPWETQAGKTARPIPAPEDYRSPLADSWTSGARPTLEAPPLAPSGALSPTVSVPANRLDPPMVPPSLRAWDEETVRGPGAREDSSGVVSNRVREASFVRESRPAGADASVSPSVPSIPVDRDADLKSGWYSPKR